LIQTLPFREENDVKEESPERPNNPQSMKLAQKIFQRVTLDPKKSKVRPLKRPDRSITRSLDSNTFLKIIPNSEASYPEKKKLMIESKVKNFVTQGQNH
jgi:hypothetical protein